MRAQRGGRSGKQAGRNRVNRVNRVDRRERLTPTTGVPPWCRDQCSSGSFRGAPRAGRNAAHPQQRHGGNSRGRWPRHATGGAKSHGDDEPAAIRRAPGTGPFRRAARHQRGPHLHRAGRADRCGPGRRRVGAQHHRARGRRRQATAGADHLHGKRRASRTCSSRTSPESCSPQRK